MEGRAMAIVVAIWLRRLPKWVWGKDPHFEAMKKNGRVQRRRRARPPSASSPI
jgi:hypothetical protein